MKIATTAPHNKALPTLLVTVLGVAATGACGDNAADSIGMPITSATGSATSSASTTASMMTTSAAPSSSTPPTVSSSAPSAKPSTTMSTTPPIATTSKPSALPAGSATTANPDASDAPPTMSTPGSMGTGGSGPEPEPTASSEGNGGSDDPPDMTGGGGTGDDPMSGSGEPVPSAGCGKAAGQLGSSGSPLMVASHQYYVKLPTDYDQDTPHKVMIMFNPTGNPISWAEQNAGYEQQAADAIRVYPHPANSGSGWQPSEISFFPALVEEISNNFCIDTSRVFAGGESSGGDYVGFVGCEHGDLLRGIAPCATKTTSWALDASQHDCIGNPLAIVIQSPADSVVGFTAGPQVRDMYSEINMCTDMATPVEGYTDALSNCELYSGCMAGSEVYFCQHDDPNYGGTHHGWPGFAAKMTWEVFSAL